MTQFWDPFHPAATVPIVDQPAYPIAPAGYPSPPVNITANVTVVVPPPVGATGGATPPNLPWATIANCSPFALSVGTSLPSPAVQPAQGLAGRFVGVVPPFTIMKVALDPSASNNGFLLSPQPYANIVQDFPVSGLPPHASINNLLGGPNVAYVVWYDEEPQGNYPTGIGPGFPLTSQMLVQFNPGGISAGPFSQNVQLEPWMQTLAVRITPTGGTANGWFVSFLDLTVGANVQSMVVGANQWVYIPVNGMSGTISVTNLLNGALGGTFGGQIMIHGLAGPLYAPVSSSFMTLAGGFATQLGLSASANVAGSSSVNLIPTNLTGTVVRVRAVTVNSTTAQASVQGYGLRGHTSSTNYWRNQCPAAIFNNQDDPNFLVCQSGLLDPTEGLDAFNNGNATMFFIVQYDLLPYAYATASP